MTRFSAFMMLVLATLATFDASAATDSDNLTNAAADRPAVNAGGRDTAKTDTDAPMASIRGRVADKKGPLPGAVVKLRGTNQATVTNAQGEFQLLVPANAGGLPATVSYAGYADVPTTLSANAGSEITVRLLVPQAVQGVRRNQLKGYLRTARRQVHRSLRQVHAAKA